MKQKLVSVLSALALAFVFTPMPAAAVSTATVVDAKSFRSTNGIGNTFVTDTATDAAGNVYVMGQSNVNILDSDGGTTPVFNFQFTATDNIFVAKYNSAGVKQWVQDIGTTSNESAATLAVSASGTIAVGGRLCMPLVVAPNISISPISQFCDGFLAVLDTDGNGQWAKVFGEPNQSFPNQWVNELEFDAAGNLYAVVQSENMLDLASYGIDGTTYSVPGGVDYAGQVIVKYNPAAQLQWVKPLPFGFSVAQHTLNITAGSEVLIGGHINRAVTFDSLGTFTPTGEDGVVARLSAANRTFEIIKIFGGAGNQRISGVTTTSTGAVIALSRIESTAVVNAVNYTSLGSRDALIVKLSGATWVTDWATQFGGTGNDFFSSVKVDADDRVYTGGSIGAAVTLGSIGTFSPGVNSSVNGLAIGLEANGSIAWAKQSLSASQGFSALYGGIAISGNNVYVGGSMGTTQTLPDGITSVGNAWNCCNQYGAGYVVKINTSTVGGSVVINNVVQTDPNMIAVTQVSPRILDETAVDTTLTLSGRNLDKVKSVSQANTLLKHKLLENGNLLVELPKLSLGVHDLVLTGTGFHFSLQSAYRVQSVEVVAVSKLNDVKHAAAISKIARDITAEMQTKSTYTCVLTLSNKASAKNAQRLVAEATKFCNALNVRHVVQVVRSAQATKLELYIRGW